MAILEILNARSSEKDLIVHRPKFLLLIMFVCLDWRTSFFFTPDNRASVIVWYKKGNIVVDVVEKGAGKAAKTVLLPIVTVFLIWERGREPQGVTADNRFLEFREIP